MARIRSIHPGLFTDEAFMTASPHARLLIIGLWCEAFDDGCFELKPLTLKARIFPVDPVDMAVLLAELEGLGYFRRFTARGKEWAALRNFRKFQRPKKPNTSGVLPASLADFVGLNTPAGPDEHAENPEPAPNLFSTGSPKSAQMEDGGGIGRRELEEEAKLSTAGAEPSREAEPSRADDLRSLEVQCRDALAGFDPPKGSFAPIALLVERGADPVEVATVLRAEAAKPRKTPIASWPGWATIVGDRLATSPKLPPGQGARASPAAAVPMVFVEVDTPEWRAWMARREAEGKRGCPVADDPVNRSRRGWRFPSLWPPGTEPKTSPASVLEPAE